MSYGFFLEYGWIFILIIYTIIIIWQIKDYQKTTYYLQTKHSFFSVQNSKGKLGEYQIYKQLKYREELGERFLFNLYIPNFYGGSAEIDLLLISHEGIYVFESKNYSGWIYGSENQKMWTQVLPKGKGRKSQKERFYNPILQNMNHIKYLKMLIGGKWNIRSYIIFSDRCRFKTHFKNDGEVKVIHRSALKNYMRNNKDSNLSQEDIARLYERLYPYTQVSAEVKRQHIKDVKNISRK